METRKRLIKLLVFNVIVSALTTLVVLLIWSRLTAPDLPKALSSTPASAGAQDAATATSAPGSFDGQLAIVSVIGAGDLQNESVRIEHLGDEDVSLAGWRLSDSDGNQFRFPALVLHPGGTVTVYSRSGDDTVTQLYWNRSTATWSEGEEARLLDPRGDEQATYIVP